MKKLCAWLLLFLLASRSVGGAAERETARRLATWAKRENQYENHRNPYPNKQEANDYALHALQERMEQRRSGLQDELPKPF